MRPDNTSTQPSSASQTQPTKPTARSPLRRLSLPGLRRLRAHPTTLLQPAFLLAQLLGASQTMRVTTAP